MPNSELNPSELQARENFGSELPKAILERDSTSPTNTTSSNDPSDQTRQAEANPLNYRPNLAMASKDDQTNTSLKAKAKNTNRFKNFAKRGGPVTSAALALIVGGSLLTSSMAPAAGINHFMTNIERHFDSSGVFMNARKLKHISAKLSDLPDNIVATNWRGKRIDRLKKMSGKNIHNLEKNGFIVKCKGGCDNLGRNKVTEIIYDGQSFTKPSEISEAAAKNATLNSSLKRGTRGKWANTVDDLAKSVRERINLNVKRLFGTQTTENQVDETKQIDDQNTQAEEGDSSTNIDTDETDKNTKNFDTDLNENVAGQADGGDVDVANKIKSAADEIDSDGPNGKYKKDLANIADDLDEASKAAKAGGATGLSTKFNKTAIAKTTASLASLFNVFDAADTFCSYYTPIYMTVKFLKTEHAMELARFAILFFQAASSIRAGDATEEEISYIGDKLFDLRSTGSEWNSQPSRSAVASIGYSLAAHKEVPNLSASASGDEKAAIDSATQFQNGAPEQISKIFGKLGGATGTPARTCGFFNNPDVKTVTTIVGVAIGVVSLVLSGGLSAAAKAAWPAIRSMAMTVGAVTLAGWLGQHAVSSITRLPVSSITKGEDAGNAIASGSGVLFGKIAAGTAGGVLTKTDAITYHQIHQILLAQEVQANRLALNPFDISSPDTFMGSIFASLLPHMGQLKTFRGQLNSLASLTSQALATITPTGKAMAAANQSLNERALYNQCKDYDYNTGNFADVAFDIFCNPVYGIPVQALFDNSTATALGLPKTQTVMLANNDTSSNSGSITSYQRNINYVGELFSPEKVIAYLADNNFIKSTSQKYAEPVDKGMLDYRDQCVTRDLAPLGDSQLAENSNNKFLGEQLYGKDVGDGKNCILRLEDSDVADLKAGKTNNRNINNIMFALFYTDERVQCMIDEGEDCQFDPVVAGNKKTASKTGQVISDGTLPVAGYSDIHSIMSDQFGWRVIDGSNNFHNGLDLAVPVGTPLVALEDAVILETNTGCPNGDTSCGWRSFGNYVKYQTLANPQYVFAYAHMSTVDVAPGQKVEKGQKLGEVGLTGWTTGAHLHLAFIVNDVFTDPNDYFRYKPNSVPPQS